MQPLFGIGFLPRFKTRMLLFRSGILYKKPVHPHPPFVWMHRQTGFAKTLHAFFSDEKQRRHAF